MVVFILFAGLTTDESMISPLDMSDQPRLYSYVSGSDGEGDVDNSRHHERWERGSHSSMSSDHSLSEHCSLSDNEAQEADVRLGKMCKYIPTCSPQ